MVKMANKVTGPEKALILGFMASSQENLCQEQGNIIQVKLSKHTEDLTSQTARAAPPHWWTLCSRWMCFKKCKPMANMP